MENNLKDKDYVLVIGSSNMDLNIYSEKLPTPGETITGGVFRQCLGGKGANQAVASVRDGSTTFFIGKIGIDTLGDQMIQNLQQEGVNISHLVRDPQSHSGVAFIMIDAEGENMISVAPGANVLLHPKEIHDRADIVREAKSLIVQMEIPLETIERIFSIASEGECIKILNPAPMKNLPKSIFQKIDILVPNEGELRALHSILGFKRDWDEGTPRIKQVEQIARSLSSLGTPTVITTLGAKGCLIYEDKKDSCITVPAFKVRAVDTVGAGDCFCGVLTSELSKQKPLLEAVKYATCAASIAVTRRGAQASLPYYEEIIARVQQYESINQ
ncbi:MAG: Ribokinase [Promethearchaeota archaeon]|nr:MAG: Ribokinase [Candidatus Lokiarchaeota archaeon]